MQDYLFISFPKDQGQIFHFNVFEGQDISF